MPVDRVIAKICFTTLEPLRERRLAEIADFPEGFVPVNRFGLFSPEALRLFQGATTEFKRLDWLAHEGE